MRILKQKKQKRNTPYSLNTEFGMANKVYKQKFNVKRAVKIFLFFVIIVVAIICTSISISKRLSEEPDVLYLKTLWDSEDYTATYEYSENILFAEPFNNIALTYNGYAAFYLALSSTETVSIHTYIDKAINSLRLALLDAKDELVPQLDYMLGKAYFHKNKLSAYYFYSDLAIKYLHKALDKGYNASDIYEYLGLSYASLDMTSDSIANFTEALLVNDSDVLKIAIAEQYYKIGNFVAAKPYLQRIKDESDNDNYRLQCSNLLGLIYIDEGNLIEAETQFNDMLKIHAQNADAYYGLGLVYEQEGDFIKARAQWRKVLEIETNHPGARLKLN